MSQSNAFAQHTQRRFRVSANLPPSFRKQGFRFEVVDSAHPSDGGPVAISWHKTREAADAEAKAQTRAQHAQHAGVHVAAIKDINQPLA